MRGVVTGTLAGGNGCVVRWKPCAKTAPMSDAPIHVRRARRTDFTAVMELLATTGTPVPPPDRATLRRFRNIVKDLGGDLYLAFRSDRLVGLVHATYCRQLAGPPLARIEQLVVRAEELSIVADLTAWISRRAAKRGCQVLQASCEAVHLIADDVLLTSGWRADARGWRASLAPASSDASE